MSCDISVGPRWTPACRLFVWFLAPVALPKSFPLPPGTPSSPTSKPPALPRHAARRFHLRALSDPLLVLPPAFPKIGVVIVPFPPNRCLSSSKPMPPRLGWMPPGVTYACLRHTSAALHLEFGEQMLPGCSAFSGAKSRLERDPPSVLPAYPAAGLARRRPPACRFARRRYLPPRGRYQRKEPRRPSGNQNAIKMSASVVKVPKTGS